MRRTIALAVSALVLATCQSVPATGPASAARAEIPVLPDLAVSRAPFEHVEADWKQRIDQAYVFVEARGSYTGIGKLLERAFESAREQGLAISGPPFALYFDDPGRVPVDELRMRACLPVDAPLKSRAPLGCEVLPSTTVVYAFVSGPYPEVPRAYPGMFAYMARLNWVADGPIREIYLRNPASVATWDELVTEVQIPATLAR